MSCGKTNTEHLTNYWQHIFSFCAPPYWLSALLSRVGGGLSRTRTKEVLMGLVSAVSGVVTTPPTEPPPATEPRLKPLRLRRRLPPGTESPGPRPAGPSTRRSAPPSTRSSARPLTTRSVPWPTDSRWRPQSLLSSVEVSSCVSVPDCGRHQVQCLLHSQLPAGRRAEVCHR